MFFDALSQLESVQNQSNIQLVAVVFVQPRSCPGAPQKVHWFVAPQQLGSQQPGGVLPRSAVAEEFQLIAPWFNKDTPG